MTSLLVVGDFSPQGRLVDLHKQSPKDIFGEFFSTIAGVDLAILNLEAPLCKPAQSIVKTGPALHGNPEVVSFIADSGFGLACLANNHILDYGPQGLAETMAGLHQAGIAQVGAGQNCEEAAQPYLADLGNRRVAILNFAENEWSTTRGDIPGACPIDPVRNFAAIQSARDQSDHLLVITHGGHERYALPSPGMQELFRFYIDAGADAVVNHHTHCTSGYEIHRGKPIFHSLGNFLFDSPQSRNGAWTQGMGVELTFEEDEVSFQLHHFDQCTEIELFRVVDDKEISIRNQHLDRLNQIIKDPDALAERFSAMTSERERLYQAYLEPKLPRLIGAAQRRGWLPSLLSRRHRTLLLNLVRCESHREIILELLKHDAGHSR